MSLLADLQGQAAQRPDHVALIGVTGAYCYHDLLGEVNAAMRHLAALNVRVLALDIDNGPAWVALDLAALELGLCVVPLPPFFSAAQLQHVIDTAGVEIVLSDNPAHFAQRTDLMIRGAAGWRVAECRVTALRIANRVTCGNRMPDAVRKITFTSGTTGEPKGVLLGWQQMRDVAVGLIDAVGFGPGDRHLVLAPLSLLLENIAGVYAPLIAGGTAVVLPSAEVGLHGSSQIDGRQLVAALSHCAATTVIFTPQLLQALVEALEHGAASCPRLRFAAVGGAPVSPRLLERATQLGLPVYEGYGLSECASVVCMNTPTANRPGSVGKALAHQAVTIDVDNEVVISGALFLGYLGESPTTAPASWHSGDVGHLDDDGFLHLSGRRREVFITAFGRNVAPEWVERELVLEPAIVQAAVFGEARPFNVAVIVTTRGQDDSVLRDSGVDAALRRVNAYLPDYARVTHWVAAEAPFSPRNGMLTASGRLRREAIFTFYRDAIESLYLKAASS